MSKIFPGKDRLPVLGVGLSFRPEIESAICEHLQHFDFMEVIVDNALAGILGTRFWSEALQRLPFVGHGVETSLGTREPVDTQYLHSVEEVLAKMGCAWFSEHMAFTKAGHFDMQQLMPVQFCQPNVEFIATQIQALCDVVRRPFLLENPAYYFMIPGATMSEVEFMVSVLARAECGMLLDVNNLYANARNHGYDAHEYIDRLPSAAVVEIHVAGGTVRNGIYIDTHGHAVSREVLELLRYAVQTKQPNAVVLEREQNFPPIDELLAEVGAVRRIWDECSVRASRRAAVEDPVPA
jgi:uncharacterized protein (UPF0276 family)